MRDIERSMTPTAPEPAQIMATIDARISTVESLRVRRMTCTT
jgi:hypothetical protein